LGLILAVATGISVGMLVIPPPTPGSLAGADHPTAISVGRQPFSDEITVGLELQVSEGTPLTSRRAGIVTGPTQPPRLLESGAAVMSVDLHPVIGLHTRVPLFRDLELGDSGDDVDALNDALRRLGAAIPSSQTLSAAAVEFWQTLITAAGATEISHVHLDDIVWLPDDTVDVDTWLAVPGASVDVGQTLGITGPRLVAATVRLGQERKDATRPEGDPEGRVLPPTGSAQATARTLTVFGATTTVDDINSPLPQDFLRAVESTSDFRQYLTSEARDRVATGTLSLVEPIQTLRVPAGALFGVSGAQACVQVGGEALPVTIVRASLTGTLIVVDSERPVDQVAVGRGITHSECQR
jgi:hypothetical protein